MGLKKAELALKGSENESAQDGSYKSGAGAGRKIGAADS